VVRPERTIDECADAGSSREKPATGGVSRPRLLDLFCCAGGAAMGYQRAGFEVVGVDIRPQPRYPFEFVQADVLGLSPGLLASFDAIHASPPCQNHSTVTGKSRAKHPDLISPTRALLRSAGSPAILENVRGAPLLHPVRLCGSSFGLDLERHRLFEGIGWDIAHVPPCDHHWQTPRFRSLEMKSVRAGRLARVVGVHGHINYAGEFPLRCAAMDIDWMTNEELVEAIPPAYTEFLGRQLLAEVRRRAVGLAA
jgi:DNA (cytosine-5)-methyltransferase 1